MATHAANLSVVFRGDFAPGVYAETVNVAAYPLGGLQWCCDAVDATTKATFAVYASLLQYRDERLVDADPATNKYWSLQPTAIPSSNPGEVVKSTDWSMGLNAGATLLVVMTVALQLDGFELFFRGQEY